MSDNFSVCLTEKAWSDIIYIPPENSCYLLTCSTVKQYCISIKHEGVLSHHFATFKNYFAISFVCS